MWTPINEEIIKKDVEYCNDILFNKPSCLKFWEYIKITPEKWQENTMGKDGGGFWVIAILGKSVIYYNDIEEGYNLSTFRDYGKIENYNCSQMELHEMIESLFYEIGRKNS
ncbi:hypothetical protein [Chryseobacterium sp. NKUCC03_KSP]|jgi:hypothetical protein|uniref:hypothetical protein n=1 Tax=Chryseobacterium sp. NKUCC03_KSP TaxID=2842125 RepID=UPI001C5A5B6A|nr:hypothetical protein [Chryseobacterium sp. NKUCC03_KSP]MBW3524041.1 hypothetical protein [Chryseobacterium sp. NKUCC03_KSP]